jgi:hypothetical protein
MTGRRLPSRCLCLLCEHDITTRTMPTPWRSNLSIDASMKSSNQASRTSQVLAVFIGMDLNSSGDHLIATLNSESMEKSIHRTRFWRWSLGCQTSKDARSRRQLSLFSYILIQLILPTSVGVSLADLHLVWEHIKIYVSQAIIFLSASPSISTLGQ